jgi:hypothetical protein
MEMNVRETHKFNGDLRLFGRDGSRLLVKEERYFAWPGDVDAAIPVLVSVYELLVAEDMTGSVSDAAMEGAISIPA